MKLAVSWTRARIAWCIGAFILILLSILSFTLAPSQAQARVTTSPVELTQGWQYHWGDFPLDDAGIPMWTKELIADSQWKSFRFPEKLEKPAEETFLWLRVPLPQGQWKSPSIYLRSVPYILGVYLQNRLLYTEYSLTASGEAQLDSYQWPIVSLNPDFPGQFIFFRVYSGTSSSLYIGLFDRVTVGSQADLIKRLLQQEFDSILGVFFALLGLIAIFLAISRQEKQSYLSFGLLSILIGLYTIARSNLITLFINNTLFLDYTHYISVYLMPVSACLFFEEMFGAEYKKIIQRLCQIHLAYAVVALPLVIAQIVSWSSTVLPVQILLLSSALVLMVIAVKASRTGNWDAKVYTIGFISLTLCVIHDVLIYIFEPLHWYYKLYPRGK